MEFEGPETCSPVPLIKYTAWQIVYNSNMLLHNVVLFNLIYYTKSFDFCAYR